MNDGAWKTRAVPLAAAWSCCWLDATYNSIYQRFVEDMREPIWRQQFHLPHSVDLRALCREARSAASLALGDSTSLCWHWPILHQPWYPQWLCRDADVVRILSRALGGYTIALSLWRPVKWFSTLSDPLYKAFAALCSRARGGDEISMSVQRTAS